MPMGWGRVSWVTALCVAMFVGAAGCQTHLSSGPGLPVSTTHGTAAKPVSPLPVTSSEPETFPTCAPGQVSFTYRAGGFGTGNNFGVIVMANVGAATCELRNLRLAVSPVDRTGRVISTQPGWVNVARAARLTLSAHGGPPRGEQTPPQGDQWAVVLLGGGGRDDPREPNGLCAPRHEVTPYAWRVTGTFSATVRNIDTYMVAHPSRGSSPSIYACADPYLALLNIDISPQP
jgi:hypothetical protein